MSRRRTDSEEYYNGRKDYERRSRSNSYDNRGYRGVKSDSEENSAEDMCKVQSFDRNYNPKELNRFDQAKFPSPFYRCFDNLGFVKPTPIQRYGIPIGMDHKDIIGIAKTGSGKTLAFILPGLCEVLEERKYLQKTGGFDNRKTPLALVIAPTRELAMQIYQCALPFSKSVG